MNWDNRTTTLPSIWMLSTRCWCWKVHALRLLYFFPALLDKRGRLKIIGLEGPQPIEIHELLCHLKRWRTLWACRVITANKGGFTEWGADPVEGARGVICAWCLQWARDRALPNRFRPDGEGMFGEYWHCCLHAEVARDKPRSWQISLIPTICTFVNIVRSISQSVCILYSGNLNSSNC